MNDAPSVSLHWLVVVGYASATMLGGAGAVFRRVRLSDAAAGVLGATAMVHALALWMRWVQTGHGPYLGRYEAFSSHALAIAIVFLILRWRLRMPREGIALVAPASFLMLGLGILAPAEMTYPSPAMNSLWLRIHVIMAKLALATTVAAVAAAALLLVRASRARRDFDAADWKGLAEIDLLSCRCVAYVLFLMSVVILSGSLWAQAAWGSYWSWDPVETWSLAFWSGCGAAIHARGSRGWTGTRWARLVLALGVLGIGTFVGYGHFGVSLHAAYIAP
ncbi:MAG: cytochrome c biogenesis protein CcsA [Chloroflexota bacterium]